MKNAFFRMFTLVMLLTAPAWIQAQDRLPAIIGSHMVIQQKSDVPLWGWTDPGTQVTITATWDNQVATARAGTDGKWMASVTTPEAGGPFTIRIRAKSETVLRDVLIGEVWLCSGQSNMEMPLRGWPEYGQLVDGSEAAIQAADNPKLRLFTVARATSFVPVDTCSGLWEASTPETAAYFSAVGYFFGSELQKRLKVPVGLIHSSWGGTPAEAWTSQRYIDPIDYFQTEPGHCDAAKYLQKKQAQYEAIFKEWQKIIDFDPPKVTPDWATPDYNDKSWELTSVPGQWSTTSIGDYQGVIEYRYTFKVPKSWEGKKAILKLGVIDEIDHTYVNGKLVGTQLFVPSWSTEREYEIPAGILTKGKNLLCVKVGNTSGAGGLSSEPKDLKIYLDGSEEEPVPLSGKWKTHIGLKLSDVPPVPWCDNCSEAEVPTTLYNGMIAPLIPFTIKGAIWYQGESNRYDGNLYKTIFPSMIKNWREDWGIGDFPFYFVQIAPYNYNDERSTGLLREAQLETFENVLNTGMVVTTDIGTLRRIHPPDKKTVGLRLMLWALAKDYGQSSLYFSGPIYRSMEKEGRQIRLTFTYHCGGLWSTDDDLTCFQIAGADKVFHPAKAVIDQNTVVVSSEEVPRPVAVRFCWESTDQPNFFNKARLPASPFRTDSWK